MEDVSGPQRPTGMASEPAEGERRSTAEVERHIEPA
jgi:hypothetical protein